MTAGNDFDPALDQPTLFSARVTPHRSLNRTGFLVLMGFFGIVSFVAGVAFCLMGAWPVLGFFGLDVLVIYWAFRVNFRSAAATEDIMVTPTELRVRRVSHRGHLMEWSFNPLWVQLEQTGDPEFGIEAMADAAAVTPDELHHLFRRWAGLTPKAFMQALTLDHAKGLLRDSASVLDAALDSGLSGPSRLHDLFVTHEAMSPGEWKNGGVGMTLRYGFHPSPFGTAIVIASGRGLAGLAFADPGEEQASLADMQRRWPRATYVEDHAGTAALAQRIFDTKLWRADQPLRVVLIGTDFEVRVWESLLKIPMGRAVCYSDIAT